MTLDEVAKELESSDWFKQSCRNIGKENWKDLRQELYLVLCEKDIEQIYPYLKWWVIKTLVNIAAEGNNRKAFYKDFQQKNEPLSGIEVAEHHFNFNDELKDARDYVCGREYWFKVKIYELYESGEKYSAIYRRTGIFHKTVKEAITDIQDKIKKRYEYNLRHNINTILGDSHS